MINTTLIFAGRQMVSVQVSARLRLLHSKRMKLPTLAMSSLISLWQSHW